MRQKTFLRLLEPLKPGLFGFACRMLGSGEDARDALQELTCRLLEKHKELNDRKNIRSYCYTVMHHLCVDQLRQRKKLISLEDLPEDPAITHNSQPITHNHFPSEVYELSNLVELIKAEVENLPYKQRVIIELHDFQEFSHEEIAGMLNLEVNAVRVNLSRARSRLAAKFQKEAQYEQ